jgi:uncharacterized protein YqjF (DUF2071 family)
MKCKRTACQTEDDVVCKHRDTGYFYCLDCARKINRACGDTVVHFPYDVEQQLTMKNGDVLTVKENLHTGAYVVERDSKKFFMSYTGIQDKL